MAKVSIKSVTKIFQGNPNPAVDNISIEVEDKQFVVLVGPSGCGKSTTLRMVAGLEEITQGEIFIGDQRVNDVPPKDRDIAMVFQNYALYPHMKVYDNMAFGLKLRKYPKDEINRRVQEAAEILGIQDLLERRPKALSGGQRQRVAVGRAIVRKPKVFLFDEPLSNLDAKLRVQMRAEISKLHTRLQSTMIYVTHDQIEAMTMGDKIVVMNDGLAQQIADPLTIYDHPVNRFVAGFIGTPPMNFMEGSIEKKDGGFYFNEGNFSVKVPEILKERVEPFSGKEITMGIRPEDIDDKALRLELPDEYVVNALVEVIEPMGAEAYVYLTSGRIPFIARMNNHDNLKVNQKVDIVFDMEQAYFFDKTTGKAIV